MTAASLLRDLTAFSVQIALVTLGMAVLLKLVKIPAGARYLGLRVALVASLVAPWLLRTPEVQAPALATAAAQATSVAAVPAASAPFAPGTRAAAAAPATSTPAVPWMQVGFGALLIGIAVRVVWLGIGVLRLLRLKRAGVVVDAPEYSELQQQLGTRATIAQVAALSQPATFGIRRPMVLLPDALAAAPGSLRRAVVTHELFHVQRRDWLAVLTEEMVRTALWFHPAIHWMTAQIQLAREEIVDELTVRATGDRRTYVEALLAFADTPGLSPAPAFAHRRQLFHRILSVSKETVMSRPRIVSSVAVLIAAVSAASWWAATLVPIVKAANVDPQVSKPPVAVRPAFGVQAATRSDQRLALDGEVVGRTGDPSVRAASAMMLLDQQTGAVLSVRPITPENPIPRRTRGVAPVTPPQYASAQVVVSARVTVDRNGAVTSADPDACSASGGRNADAAVCAAFHDATAAAIRQWRYDRPAQAPIQFYVRVTFRPGAEAAIVQSGESYLRETQDSLRVLAEQAGRGDDRVATDDFLRIQLAELSARFRELERAQRLAIERGPGNPDLPRLQQEMERLNNEMGRLEEQLRNANVQRADEARAAAERLRGAQRQLEETRVREQLQQLRAATERLREAQEQLEAGRRQPEQTTTAAVSPEPAPAPDGSRQLVSPSGRVPLRMNGAPPPGLQQPTPTKSIKPTYPLDALQARLQGTVVVEALVDERGRVADARVLRGISPLDQAALDSAKQWEFRPAMLNGEPVPVLLVLEMHFTLK